MIPHQDYPSTCDLLGDSRNYYGLKRTPIERALVAAAGMGPPDARSVLMLICQAGMTTTEKVEQPPSPGAIHYARREKIIKRTKAACDRVIDYAKHETLRKVEKHFRENPIAAGEGEGHPFRGNQYTSGETSPQTEGETQLDQKQKLAEIRKRGNAMAERMGFPTNKIDYLEMGDPVKFNVGDRQFVRAGFFSPTNGRITIDSTAIQNPAHMDSIMAHEVSHAQFDVMKTAQEAEHNQISKLLQNKDPQFEKLFQFNGYPHPEALPELRRRFPASAAFARTWGDSYLSDTDKMQQMIKDDGISDYSKAYWAKGAVDQNMGLHRAVDETVAEVNSWAHTGAAHLSRPSRDWEQLARDVRVMYKRIKTPYQEIKSL